MQMAGIKTESSSIVMFVFAPGVSDCKTIAGNMCNKTPMKAGYKSTSF